MLPRRIPKPEKRQSRWKSTAHRDFVRSFACAFCGSVGNREAAHVRMNSGAGMGQKPDDWRVVPLCAGLTANAVGELGCHNVQHLIGEPTFWRKYQERHGQTVEDLIQEFIEASPKRREINLARSTREPVAANNRPGRSR